MMKLMPVPSPMSVPSRCLRQGATPHTTSQPLTVTVPEPIVWIGVQGVVKPSATARPSGPVSAQSAVFVPPPPDAKVVHLLRPVLLPELRGQVPDDVLLGAAAAVPAVLPQLRLQLPLRGAVRGELLVGRVQRGLRVRPRARRRFRCFRSRGSRTTMPRWQRRRQSRGLPVRASTRGSRTAPQAWAS